MKSISCVASLHRLKYSLATVAHRAQKKKNSGTRGKRRRRSASGTESRMRMTKKTSVKNCFTANSKDRKDILKVDPNMWLLPETKEYLKLEKKESAEEQKQEGKRSVTYPSRLLHRSFRSLAMPRIVSPVQ